MYKTPSQVVYFNLTSTNQYAKVGEAQFYLNFETGELQDSPLIKITSLDLSDTIYLEEIGEKLLYIPMKNVTAVNDTCVYTDEWWDTGSGTGYKDCHGYLEEFMLPESDSLKLIGERAFENNLLTVVVVNSKVVGESAFHSNRLKKVIIKSNVQVLSDYAFTNNGISADGENGIATLLIEDTRKIQGN